MIARSRPWNEPFDIARRLIDVIDSQNILSWTKGQWEDWRHRLERLPANCRQWVWRQMGERFSPETVRYLQTRGRR